MKESQIKIDFNTLKLLGNIEKTINTLEKTQSIYENIENCDLNTLMYQVEAYCFENMSYAITTLYPLTINNECNMTKGHFHKTEQDSEIYMGLDGEGILLMMDILGNTILEHVTKGSVHYVDGKYAHRLINTGDTNLVVGAIYPTNAGHDYDKVKQYPFRTRIYKKDNNIEIKEI